MKPSKSKLKTVNSLGTFNALFCHSPKKVKQYINQPSTEKIPIKPYILNKQKNTLIKVKKTQNLTLDNPSSNEIQTIDSPQQNQQNGLFQQSIQKNQNLEDYQSNSTFLSPSQKSLFDSKNSRKLSEKYLNKSNNNLLLINNNQNDTSKESYSKVPQINQKKGISPTTANSNTSIKNISFKQLSPKKIKRFSLHSNSNTNNNNEIQNDQIFKIEEQSQDQYSQSTQIYSKNNFNSTSNNSLMQRNISSQRMSLQSERFLSKSTSLQQFSKIRSQHASPRNFSQIKQLHNTNNYSNMESQDQIQQSIQESQEHIQLQQKSQQEEEYQFSQKKIKNKSFQNSSHNLQLNNPKIGKKRQSFKQNSTILERKFSDQSILPGPKNITRNNKSNPNLFQSNFKSPKVNTLKKSSYFLNNNISNQKPKIQEFKDLQDQEQQSRTDSKDSYQNNTSKSNYQQQQNFPNFANFNKNKKKYKSNSIQNLIKKQQQNVQQADSIFQEIKSNIKKQQLQNQSIQQELNLSTSTFKEKFPESAHFQQKNNPNRHFLSDMNLKPLQKKIKQIQQIQEQQMKQHHANTVVQREFCNKVYNNLTGADKYITPQREIPGFSEIKSKNSGRNCISSQHQKEKERKFSDFDPSDNNQPWIDPQKLQSNDDNSNHPEYPVLRVIDEPNQYKFDQKKLIQFQDNFHRAKVLYIKMQNLQPFEYILDLYKQY